MSVYIVEYSVLRCCCQAVDGLGLHTQLRRGEFRFIDHHHCFRFIDHLAKLDLPEVIFVTFFKVKCVLTIRCLPLNKKRGTWS